VAATLSVKTRWIKTSCEQVSRQRTFEDSKRWTATDCVGQIMLVVQRCRRRGRSLLNVVSPSNPVYTITTCCQTGCQTRLTTGCIVYTNIQQPVWQPAVSCIQPVVKPVVKPVVQPDWQSVVSCKRGITIRSADDAVAERRHRRDSTLATGQMAFWR